MEYIPPKPAKGVEGDIIASDQTDLGALPGEEGEEEEEEELEGGGATGVASSSRWGGHTWCLCLSVCLYVAGLRIQNSEFFQFTLVLQYQFCWSSNQTDKWK